MKAVKDVFILESKRLLNRKTIGLFFIISLLSLYFVQIGSNDYKSIIENREKFQDIEKLKVKQYINYAQYGTYGFRILFIPSPLSIYFINSSTIPELTSNVDAGERLNIYNSFKGKTLFAEKSGGFKDFSGIMLLLGSLLVLHLGYSAFIYKDYLRFVSCFIGYRKLFTAIILSRILIFILLFLLNVGVSLLLLQLNNIVLSRSELFRLTAYLGVMLLMLAFFFVLGTIAGSFKSRFAGFVLVIISWFVFVFFIPGVVNSVTARAAGNIASNYQLELEKLKTLMDFEQRALARRRALEDSRQEAANELRRALIESYWDNEVKEINTLEKELGQEMNRTIRHFQLLSSFFPSTFYLSAGNEISSKGYENFINFFDYIQGLKEEFVRFYINKRYYSNFTRVESFITERENLFAAASRLPKGFLFGAALTLVYILGLAAASYSRFKKSLRL